MCASPVAVRHLGGGSDEVGRAGVPGEANRIDCVGVITGNSLSFGYRSLVGPAQMLLSVLSIKSMPLGKSRSCRTAHSK
jgi:hypothetical protein